MAFTLIPAHSHHGAISESNSSVHSNIRLCQCYGNPHANRLRNGLCAVRGLYAGTEGPTAIRIRATVGSALEPRRRIAAKFTKRIFLLCLQISMSNTKCFVYKEWFSTLV